MHPAWFMGVSAVAHRKVDRSNYVCRQLFETKILEVHQDGVLWHPTKCRHYTSARPCTVHVRDYCCRWVYDRPLPFALTFTKYRCAAHDEKAGKSFTLFSRHVQDELKVSRSPDRYGFYVLFAYRSICILRICPVRTGPSPFGCLAAALVNAASLSARDS
jgi:hypothetical protein